MKDRTAAISMRDLQTMTAEDIQALPHTVPIKNGAETVGMLMPVRRAASQEHSQEYLRKVFADIDAAAARRTPEENEAIDRLLAERGID